MLTKSIYGQTELVQTSNVYGHPQTSNVYVGQLGQPAGIQSAGGFVQPSGMSGLVQQQSNGIQVYKDIRFSCIYLYVIFNHLF